MAIHELSSLWLGVYPLDYQSAVSVVVRTLSYRVCELPYSLIMWWDSGGPATLSGTVQEACSRTGASPVQAPGGVAVTTPELVKLAADEGCLFGFDVVWLGTHPFTDAPFLPTRLSSQRQIETAPVNGPVSADLELTKLWMESNHAVLGLADGGDLEVVTRSFPLATDLDRMLARL